MANSKIARLTVLYDPQCALCRRLQGWMLGQPVFVELSFVAAASADARHRFPELDHALTLKDLTVISDRGAIYWGPKAWLMCLWSLKQYRAWSFRLSAPGLLPTTRKVVSMISENRHKLDFTVHKT
jgi:predicted DCC family thiol-disulfide oxidoreductase YuxK